MTTGTAGKAADLALQVAESLYISGDGLWTQLLTGYGCDEQEARRIVRLLGDQALAAVPVVVTPKMEAILNQRSNLTERDYLISGLDYIALRRIWSRYRYVCDVDPDLWVDLGDANESDDVPTDTFDWFPYPDPFIAFPESLDIRHGRETMRVVGMYVAARSPVRAGEGGMGRAACSMSIPDHGPILVTFIGLMFNPDGSRVMVDTNMQDITFTRVTLEMPEDHETVTVGALIDIAISAQSPFASADPESLRLMIRRAVSLLLYLCATNADTEPLTKAIGNGAVRRLKSRGTRNAKAPKLIGVGYRIGAAIRDYRHRDTTTQGSGAGRTVAPHVRRPHRHIFRYGPGWSKRRIKYLGFIEVNMSGDLDKPTVVPVKKQPRNKR